MGGKILAPDTLSAEWIRLQPIKSQYTLCQSKKVFSEEYEKQLLIELGKKPEAQSSGISGKKPRQDQTLIGTRNSLMTWKVSLSERLTQGCYDNMWKSCWRRLKCSKPSTFSLQSNSNLVQENKK